MTRQEVLFILVLLVNLAVALVYYFLNMYRDDEKEGRVQYSINLVVMLLCPVIGPLFLGTGYLMFRFVMHEPVDLEDVIFSKEKRDAIVRADEDREMNFAPVEEALAVSDKVSLRRLMLNVIKGDISNSLRVISLALNSEDSETSHYAASVLVDELNNFRINVQKLYLEMRDEEGQNDTQERCEYAATLVQVMNPILLQKVFTQLEQEDLVEKMDEACQLLYDLKSQLLQADYYEAVALRLLEVKKFERCEQWCERAMEQFPKELSSHTCRMKLYFTLGEKEKFFEALSAMKQSEVVIDQETLELIRVFQA